MTTSGVLFHDHFKGGPLPWPLLRGVPCDLSHNALDVTSLLSRHQMMGLAWCTCLYSVAPKLMGRSHGTSQSSNMTTSRGVPCDLSHNALNVTSLLSRHQMMGLAWCTCLYSVALKHYGKVTWDPPQQRVGQTDRQTNTCENITLPQTTYAGGNKENYTWKFGNNRGILSLLKSVTLNLYCWSHFLNVASYMDCSRATDHGFVVFGIDKTCYL